MSIGRIASKQAVTVALGASLEDAAVQMLRHGVGAIVVTDGCAERAAVVGIITDRDIVRARLEHSSALSALDVADVMSRQPLVLDDQQSVSLAVRHLRARRVRRAPVLDAQGRLLGLVSTDDLLGEIARQLSALAQVLARQGRKPQAA